MTKHRMPESVRRAQREITRLLHQDAHGLGLVRQQRVMAILQRESNRHSVELEYASERAIGKRGAFERALDRQSDAWRYATNAIGERGLVSALELSAIAHILVPDQRLSPYTGFRLDEVQLTGGTHKPPSPTNVPVEMEQFFRGLKRMESPLERAIFAHYHLTRVGSSRVDLQACKLEYSIVSPK